MFSDEGCEVVSWFVFSGQASLVARRARLPPIPPDAGVEGGDRGVRSKDSGAVAVLHPKSRSLGNRHSKPLDVLGK